MHNVYQQFYKGVEVQYAEFFIHHKDSNSIKTINCKLVEGLNTSAVPAYTEAQALTTAINHLGANNTYIWQDSASESILKIDNNDSISTYYPVGKLVFAKVGNDKDFSNTNFKLAWKFEITTVAPTYSFYDIYIDATNNTFIKKLSKIHQDGPASLMYYGTQTIDTKPIGFNYYLKANNGTRNLHTKISNGFVNDFAGWNNVLDGNDDWPLSDAHSTTAHWCATRAYDFFRFEYNHYGCDDNSGEIRVLANRPEQGCSYTYAGNGNQLNKKDYITVGYTNNNYSSELDAIGHEFTHGIDKHNGDLEYINQSGALDESFADIFGVMVQKDNGTLNWTIGELSGTLRVIDNPSTSPTIGGGPQPSVYLVDINWYAGPVANDNGGVHTNSGVQNYWFYLLSQGSAGAPGGVVGNVIVNSIGINNAANIAFYNLVNYIGNLSQYTDAAIGSILSARDIYGLCSNELKQTQNAWAAVRIGVPYSPLTISGPNTIYYLQNGSIFGTMPKTFVATGGVVDPYYVWPYSGPWIHNVSGNFHQNFNITNFLGNYSGTLQVNAACESVSKNINFFCLDCPVNGGDPTYTGGVISLSPNPTTTMIKIKADYIDPNSNDEIIVTIVDMNGIYKFQQTYQNSLPESIDVSNYADGTYIVIVHQGSNAQQIRFVKE
jgi:Zn-dependent metalloprotease